MNQPIQLHHAFTIDYSAIARELRTQIKVGSPSLTGPFDPQKYLFESDFAIWDTGATSTVITKKIVDALSLAPTGMTEVTGFNSSGPAPTYVVDIILPNNVLIENVNVVEGAGNFDVLIGMDIIQIGDLAISNPRGKTKFSFCIPSHSNPICLVEKSDKVNKRLAKKGGLRSKSQG